MLPAFSPDQARLVNDRALSFTWDIADGVVVSQIINPEGSTIYHHVYFRSGNGHWETINDPSN